MHAIKEQTHVRIKDFKIKKKKEQPHFNNDIRGKKRKSRKAQLKPQLLLLARNISCMPKAANSEDKHWRLQTVEELGDTELVWLNRRK